MSVCVSRGFSRQQQKTGLAKASRKRIFLVMGKSREVMGESIDLPITWDEGNLGA